MRISIDTMSKTESKNLLHGIVAEFSTTDDVLRAAEKIRDAGYTRTDGYTPVPVHGLPEALGLRKSRLAALVLCGGTAGLFAGFALQYWVSVFAYPHMVSGKPFFSWPSFVPVMFECTILGAALSAVIGMLVLNGLPQPYHPLFGAAGFDRATTDKYFLCIESTDPQFDREKTAAFMKGLGADKVTEVTSHPDDVE
jgi:Protein of unknown function (DUF3341)